MRRKQKSQHFRIIISVKITQDGKPIIVQEPLICRSYTPSRRLRGSSFDLLWALRDGKPHHITELEGYFASKEFCKVKIYNMRQKNLLTKDGDYITITPLGKSKLDESIKYASSPSRLRKKVDKKGYISLHDLELLYPELDVLDFLEAYGPARNVRVIRAAQYNEAGEKPIRKVHLKDFERVYKTSPHYHKPYKEEEEP